jgi:hypothetical protein
MVSACSTRHQTGDTDSFQLVILLTVQLGSQGIFVPCEARILWYSADRTSSRQLRDTTRILDSGVFCHLTLVDTKSVSLLQHSHAISRPPRRRFPGGCAHVHSDVVVRHRQAYTRVPSRGHDSSAIAKILRQGRQWQTTFRSLRTTGRESRPSPNAV